VSTHITGTSSVNRVRSRVVGYRAPTVVETIPMSTTEQQPPTRVSQHRPPGLGRGFVWRLVALAAALLIGTATLSYVRALTFPGDASWLARTVEWARDHGGSGLVNTVENWWYARNAPAGAAPEPASVPAAPATPAGTAAATGSHPPALPLLPGMPQLPGEAQWRPGARGAAGPALYTGWFRPDPAYPSRPVGVAWFDRSATAAHLFSGTRQPVAGGSAAAAQVPVDLRGSLVAVFNSGWKMADINGGYYAGGRAVVPLRPGAASLVVDAGGDVSVGEWGRDTTMGPQVVAVRQNLDLVVDAGRPVPGLGDNTAGRWGSAKNQFQFTWRSGVGTDAGGNLVYLAGDQLTLSGLADAMAAAGVQRGMELDIHTGNVAFTGFDPAQPDLAASGTRLLPSMGQRLTRYLVPDQRDFVAVTVRR
jgi:hypothetical protein